MFKIKVHGFSIPYESNHNNYVAYETDGLTYFRFFVNLVLGVCTSDTIQEEPASFSMTSLRIIRIIMTFE